MLCPNKEEMESQTTGGESNLTHGNVDPIDVCLYWCATKQLYKNMG